MIRTRTAFPILAATIFLGITTSFSQPLNPDSSSVVPTISELLGTRVTVASRQEMEILTTPSTVYVIDHETIEQYNFGSIADALRSLAGVEVYQTVIDRNIVTMRGVLQNFYANKVLILIDGVETFQPIYGNGFIDRIDIEHVERIEVLRGPASVLYGTNAFTGVVNIVLRKTAAGRMHGFARVGWPDKGAAGAGLAFHIGPWKADVLISASKDKRAPYEMTAARSYYLDSLLYGGTSPAYSYRGDSTYSFAERENTASITFRASKGEHSFLINAFDYDHSFPGAEPSYKGGSGTLVRNRGLLANYQFLMPFLDGWSLRASISGDWFERRFTISADRTNEVRLGGDRYFGSVGVHRDDLFGFYAELTAAAELRTNGFHETWNGMRDDLIRANMIKNTDVSEGSISAQLRRSIGIGEVQVGTRYTRDSNFGDDLSSRISGVFLLDTRTSLKAIFGQSFRTPTLFELYFDHPTAVGNPALSPEKSSSVEVAVLTETKRMSLQALVFYSLYEKLIQRITLPSGPPSVHINAGKLEGHGFELEFHGRPIQELSGYIHYTYLDGTSDARKANFRYVARHTIDGGAETRLDPFAASCNFTWMDRTSGNRGTIPSQLTADLHFSVSQVEEGMELRHTLSILNLTGSETLIPEYIRSVPTINSIPMTGYGRQFRYSLLFKL